MSRRSTNAIVSGYLATIVDKTKTQLPFWQGGKSGGGPKAHKGPRHQCKKKRKKN